jgi:putative secretion ATPase (PEP-CTERM system associated)
MYTHYFGLADRPFQLTPDARYYFESRTHKKAMAYLGYGLAQGEGFIVVTGEIGAGKSTLVAHLIATVDRERLDAIPIVSTQVEGDDMLRLAAQGMGIGTQGVSKAQLLDEIERHLRDQAAAGKRTLLIVDEAQNLTVTALEELRMLSNFQSQGRALLQIFLLGQPEFRERLARDHALEQLRQRVIATHHLGPIDAAEVEPYIRHRLGVAGWNGRPGFEEGAYQALHRHSGGIPRLLDQLAARVLLFASVEQLQIVDADAVEAVAADMLEDGRELAVEKVLPLRSASSSAAQSSPEPIRDLADERRVARLEARLDEQDAALRRVLTLLVEWVENGQETPGYRTNAA